WYLSPDFNSDSRLTDGKVGDLGDYPDGVYDSDNPIIIVDVYAYWTLGEYNLIFESNGGTAFENMVAEFGKEIALPVPVKEGYVFTGWYLSDNTKIDSGIVGNLGPVTDVNLYAEWAVETYKLIFNTNGGTVCDDKTINYGEELTLPIPTKEGYALSGWYLSSELGVDSKLNDGIVGDLGDYPDGKYDAETPIAVNVYAAWEAETYKLLFNSNGGTVCDDKTINYGEELILPAPEKVGYTFTGWYLSAELTSESKLNDGIAGDLGDYLGGIYDGVNPIEVNVYACWEIETYSLIFNTNGGSACDIQKIEYGGELTLPVPTKEGCVFTGWYLAYDCNSNSELKNGIVGDLGNMDDGVINVNVYALWAMNSYNLIFNTNGGTACASMEVEYGSDVTLPVSTKEGYVFTGWYLSDNTRLHNGTVGNLGSSKDVQVYARWQIETYNLIFNANDGSDCEDITVTYGEHISLPTTTKDGYLFSGWYYGNQLVGGLAGDMGDYPDGKYDEQNHITVNIYAAWTLEKYNITFDADGGTACTNITVNYGNIIKLPETTKEGYVFMGWYLSDGRMLSDGIVGDLGDYPNGKFDEATPIAVKATASWKIETYTLIFNSNGGTDCENVEVEYDEAVILPVSAKEGYTFAGWYLNEDLAEESKFSNGTVGDLGDLFGGVINVNLYASWQIETYTLIFNTNGGSACASLPITYGGELNLPVPKKEGYEFSGWYVGDKFVSNLAK
ncbi:MAG: InlB B-repeat-containing protein, partial [Candidatus Coproplasma sp.]